MPQNLVFGKICPANKNSSFEKICFSCLFFSRQNKQGVRIRAESRQFCTFASTDLARAPTCRCRRRCRRRRRRRCRRRRRRDRSAARGWSALDVFRKWTVFTLVVVVWSSHVWKSCDESRFYSRLFPAARGQTDAEVAPILNCD